MWIVDYYATTKLIIFSELRNCLKFYREFLQLDFGGIFAMQKQECSELHDCFKGQKAPERQLLPAYGIFRLFPVFHSSDSAAILPHSKTGNSSKDAYKNSREKFKQFLTKTGFLGKSLCSYKKVTGCGFNPVTLYKICIKFYE